MKYVSWFSAGCSSAVATKYAIEQYGTVEVYYIHIDDQHPDTMRFVKDCEKWFNTEIKIMQSDLKNVENALLKSGYVNSPYGAPCTKILKKRVRKEWERKQDHSNGDMIAYIWGLDVNERKRKAKLDNAIDSLYYTNIYPLIDMELDKSFVHGVIEHAGIKRPAMYDLGYPNNNCIGCVKGGKGYWNKIRIDFPEVFEKRAKMERIINGRIFKDCFLDELEENEGREQKIIIPDCGIFCELEHL